MKNTIDVSSEEKKLKLGDQALGALMMALQKSLMEQSDIVPVLMGFDFVVKDDTLMVENPPTFAMPEDESEDAEV